MSKRKTYEALLVISTALLVIYLFGFIRNGTSRVIYIYMACGIGVSGILVKPVGNVIALGWYKLADLLNFIMSKLIMSVIFILVLVPIAILYRLIKKDKLMLKRNTETKWITRQHKYSANDLKNIW